MVFSQDRVQQRPGSSFLSRSLTIQFLRIGGGVGLQGSRARQNSTAADVEQIVDRPARGGLRGFLPGQVSTAATSSRLLDDKDGIQGVFRTFPRPKKSAEDSCQSSARVLACPSSSELGAHQVAPAGESDEPGEGEATPCPVHMRLNSGCGGGEGLGQRAEARRQGCKLCSRPLRFLWWTSPCSSATSSSSLRVRAEGASDSVHPQLAGPYLSCNRDACPQCKLCRRPQPRNSTVVQFLGAVDKPVVVQRQAPGCSQRKQLWSSTVAESGRRHRGRGRRCVAAFRPGVGAHHTGDELN